MYAALRASTRRAALPGPSAARAGTRSAFRASAFRRYSSETPNPSPNPAPKSSHTALYAGIGAAVLGGVAIWVYTSESDAAKKAGTSVRSGVQAAKVAANYVPTKEDYIKVGQGHYYGLRVLIFNTLQVYNRITDLMDEASDKGYDGRCRRRQWRYQR